VTLATLSGEAVSRLSLQIPCRGLWWSDVDLVDESDLTGSVLLDIGGASYVGYIVSGGAFNGRSSYRVVGGFGGWGKTLPAKGYVNALGVSTATVLRDLADETGERVSTLPTTRQGPHFARVAGPAYSTLSSVVSDWYVDSDGSTVTSARAPSTFGGEYVVTRHDKGIGAIEIAVDDADGLVPGVSIAGSPSATDVELSLTSNKLICRAYYRRTLPRRIAALDAIWRALDPRRAYRGVYEYRIVSVSGDTLNLQPARVSSGAPDLSEVPIRPGMGGIRADHKDGALVLVCFADSDPGRPQVFAHDAVGAPGWMPTTLHFGDDPTLGVARLTDEVIVGGFSGAITKASTTVKAGTGAT